MALWPSTSGNAVNGLGESAPRRPVHVYWHRPEEVAADPDRFTFGRVQMWFYRHNDAPELAAGRVERKAAEAEPLAPLAPAMVARDPQDWAAAIRDEAQALGVQAVGFARLRPEWFYEGHDRDWRTIIVLGLAMDYEVFRHAPDITAGAHVVREYTRGLKASKALAGWLRSQGVDAEPEHGPFAGDMTLIPAAIAAGMGELGKHGSLINREMGACFRLAAVLTDLDLPPTGPDSFGADWFCARCRVCEDACPPQAILPDKQTVRGAEKWYVDFDRCLPYFNETAGCGICIAVCPFSRPGVGVNLVAKLARRGV